MERSREGERVTRLRDEANWVKEERRLSKIIGHSAQPCSAYFKYQYSVELKAQQRLSRSFKGAET
jgi:hypothetical protein